jgi:cytochrome c biogenesis protein CcmG, thiol:disulfide interchange protein DsbE
MKNILAAFFFTTLYLSISAQDHKNGMEKLLGDKTLPSVTLSDMNGKQVNVGDFSNSGKITVLSFWATWCVPCKKELTNMADLFSEWEKKYHMDIVAVSIDDSRNSTKVKPYVEGQRLPFQVLLDVNQDLKRQMNIQSVPFTVVTNASGKIVYTHSGYVDGDEYILEEELQKLVKQ